MRILHDTVLVKVLKEAKTCGGIILSEKTVENAPTIKGKVMCIGDGEEIAKHKLMYGSTVLIYTNVRGGFPAMPGRDDGILVPLEAILAVLEE